jgi:two-component system response regulator DevR
MTVRVFLLDDHEVVRRGLRELFEGSDGIEVVGEAGTAAEAMTQIPELHPDVAILDARLPDGSGVEVCRHVRSVDPSIRAIMLTSYDDDEALFASIMAGASGYVLKEVTGQNLVAAVQDVAKGGALMDPRVTRRIMARLRSGSEGPIELRDLTSQERRVLDLIAEGLTNREIAERIFLAEKTVKNYVSSILGKLGLERRTQAAVLAVRAYTEPAR